MYDHLEEAQARLNGTICMYGPDPVYVGAVAAAPEKQYQITAYTLPYKGGRAGEKMFLLQDPLFRYTNIPLGYANLGSTATYFARKPIRKFKQGVSSENLVSLSGKSYGDAPAGVRARDGGGPIGWNVLLSDAGFAKMFRSDYPSFKDAAKAVVKDQEASVAFSRDFALRTDMGLLKLWHKGQAVAWSEDAQKFRLAQEFEYFRETLNRSNIQTREGQEIVF